MSNDVKLIQIAVLVNTCTQTHTYTNTVAVTLATYLQTRKKVKIRETKITKLGFPCLANLKKKKKAPAD